MGKILVLMEVGLFGRSLSPNGLTQDQKGNELVERRVTSVKSLHIKIKSIKNKRGVLKAMKSLLGQPLMGCKLYIFYG